MELDPELAPAPDGFRRLFRGQALDHLDEFVLSWRTGNHLISWSEKVAVFEVNTTEGPAMLFKLHAPADRMPAMIEVDISESHRDGIPAEFLNKLWDVLEEVGSVTENRHASLMVPFGKFSRGDRKVFLAYALTIARSPPEKPVLK